MLNLINDRERIDSFLDKLIQMYHIDSRKNLPIETCTGSAMVACKQLIQDCGGRILVFSSNICNRGVGTLKNNNHFKTYSTDEEKYLYAHTKLHDFYRSLGNQALKHKVTFDLYFGVLHSSESIDLASMK